MNTQIIAIANQKGGVGKTTTCANLGIGLAQAGKKVLLIDGDPQGSLTISLGHPQPDKLPFTLSDAMGRILMDEPMRPGEGILHHPEGVDLMPADIQLSGMEVSLVNAMSRETILRQYLDTLKGQYSHKTREIYIAYRQAGYSKKFRQEHEAEILLHQAAKNAFDDMGVKKLPKVKELQTEYAKLLEEKKKIYAEYRRSREEMRELLTAKANVDRLLKMDEEQKQEKEKDHDQR
jgi:predicted nuclease with TOPRIM domain